MSEFAPAGAIVLRHEAGYVNDPADPGGETNMGISRHSYPHEDIKGMTTQRALEIYERDFWLSGNYGSIHSQVIANKLMDFAVTMERFGKHGPAIGILQKAIDDCTFYDGGIPLVVDDTIVPATIAAANAIDEQTLLKSI